VSDLGYLERLLDEAAVEWMPLGDVCTVKTGPNINKARIDQSPGPYPVINSGREPLGYFDQWNTDNDPIGITSRGAGVGLVTWTNGRFFRGNLNYSCTPNKRASLNTRFLFHFLLFSEAEIQSLATYQGIPALNAGALKKLPIPIPCPDDPQKSLAIQGEIVRILDAFTALTAELTAELTARKTQYNHYRNQLLSFEDGAVEWRTLGEIADFRRGTAITKKQTTDGKIPVVANGPVPTYFHGEYNREGETVVVARSGAYAGYVSFWNEPLFLTDAFSVHPDPEMMTSRFVYYILQNKQDQLHAMKKGAGVPHVRVKEVEEYAVPIPSLAEQARIVTILDKFDTLTTSLSEGLPREIALRQRQYEHYRNLLLGFPKGDQA